MQKSFRYFLMPHKYIISIYLCYCVNSSAAIEYKWQWLLTKKVMGCHWTNIHFPHRPHSKLEFEILRSNLHTHLWTLLREICPPCAPNAFSLSLINSVKHLSKSLGTQTMGVLHCVGMSIQLCPLPLDVQSHTGPCSVLRTEGFQ